MGNIVGNHLIGPMNFMVTLWHQLNNMEADQADRLNTFIGWIVGGGGVAFFCICYLFTSVIGTVLGVLVWPLFSLGTFLLGMIFTAGFQLLLFLLNFLVGLIFALVDLVVLALLVCAAAAVVALVICFISWICPAFPFFGQLTARYVYQDSDGAQRTHEVHVRNQPTT